MNEYHDPLSRGPKGHAPISSQPLPPHPDSSADDTVFRPTFECSQPMFPDASFDLSTTKSTTTNSHRRPLQSPHMTPPPLPPNTPSMYSRNSLPPPVPTTVHRSNPRSEDPIPPSPMQIIMSRQSTSTSLQSGREGSHSRETREPQQYDGYHQSPGVSQYSNNPYDCMRGRDREEREPPPPNAQRQFSPGFERQTDPYDRPNRDSRARNEHIGNNGHDCRHDDFHLRNYSNETHHRCNCEGCRCYKEPYDARLHDDRDRCIHHSPHHQQYNQEPHYVQHSRDDVKQPVNHYSRHERHPYGLSSEYGDVHHNYARDAKEPAPSHGVQDGQYIQTERRQSPEPSTGHSGNYNHIDQRRPLLTSNEERYRNGYENERHGRDKVDGRQSRGSSHERVTNAYHYSNGYHDGGDRRIRPPNTPTSPLSISTFDEYPRFRQEWSPKSDNATLHVEAAHVPQYVPSASDKVAPDHSRSDHYARNSNEYTAQSIDYGFHDDRGYFDSRGGHHRGQERGETVNARYADERKRRDHKYYDDQARYQSTNHHRYDRNAHHNNERPQHPAYYKRSDVPTQVSYSSQESQRERRRNNTISDSRDDYSGSTIPSHSTLHPSPHHRGHHDNQESRPQLRVDIPVSPIVPPDIRQQTLGNNHSDAYKHPPPDTSRSSGYQHVSLAPSHYNQPPITTRSDPMKHSQRPDSRVAIAERERQKSEARHQILKEIHQATDMRNSAIDENDRRFWDRQIATLSESFKKL